MQVGCEAYGGGMWHTWFDRDLGVHCQAIMESRHIDVIEMDAASNRKVEEMTLVLENGTGSELRFPWASRSELDICRALETDCSAIVFSGDKLPTSEQIADMHHLAHKECFIANSVLTEIVVKGIPSH